MRRELEEEGVEARFAAINSTLVSNPDTQAGLANLCEFPLFQDVDEVNAWGMHGGRKDDIYIYDPQGRLHVYLPISGEVSTVLSTFAGYNNVKDLLLEAAAVGEPPPPPQQP